MTEHDTLNGGTPLGADRAGLAPAVSGGATAGEGVGRAREARGELLNAARLYLCTDSRADRGDLEEFLDAAYAGGVDIIQLRDKKISAAEEIAALLILKRVAARHGKLFAVNDRADIAALVGADVFHVGQDDLSPAQARELLGPDVIIGRSTHAPGQADEAIDNPEVDYFACGPVWETPTKPGRAAAGLGYLRYVAGKNPAKPWFAIGGVNPETCPQVVDAGAYRIVVVRAITEAADARQAAQRLVAALAG